MLLLNAYHTLIFRLITRAWEMTSFLKAPVALPRNLMSYHGVLCVQLLDLQEEENKTGLIRDMTSLWRQKPSFTGYVFQLCYNPQWLNALSELHDHKSFKVHVQTSSSCTTCRNCYSYCRNCYSYCRKGKKNSLYSGDAVVKTSKLYLMGLDFKM